MNNYLIEIGTEELPPTSLKKLSDSFEQSIISSLKSAELSFYSLKAFATPRRLAVIVEKLAETTPLKNVKVWGPPSKISFDSDNKATKAAESFAKKNGTSVDQLTIENDGKIDKLVFTQQAGGEQAESLIADYVRTALSNLPIAKRMRWGSSREEFVRPIQWIVLMKDNNVIDEKILGVQASNKTMGHRFHCNRFLNIESPREYENLLMTEGHVVVDFDKRKQQIRQQVVQAAIEISDSTPNKAVISEDLLEEVCGLVEWPVALAGKFEKDFLDVPAEALISSMKEHQKYFHVVNEAGELLPAFITVSNISSKDPSQVIDGNERVIRPRLADAAFFFKTDKQSSLETKREKLKSVVFQAKLGTTFQKTERIATLSKFIAEKINSDNITTAQTVVRASQLCKSDLVSNMVNEFPEMQGIAGFHYAKNDGESEDVAQAINEHYLPRFSGDVIPTSNAGAIVALADRLDTIVGIFGIGQTPTGSKDPFALRRASLGALRILVEKKYDLDLRDLLNQAASNFESLPKTDTVVEDVLNYMIERFRSWYEEAGIAAEVFQSVSSRNLSTPLDINNRVYAVADFSKREEAKSLASANKRVANILAKAEGPVSENFDEKYFSENAERNLSNKLLEISKELEPKLAAKDYSETLAVLSQLRDPIDEFFNDVMVMTDDLNVRNNRLSLLQRLRNLFLEVADISHLDVKRK